MNKPICIISRSKVSNFGKNRLASLRFLKSRTKSEPLIFGDFKYDKDGNKSYAGAPKWLFNYDSTTKRFIGFNTIEIEQIYISPENMQRDIYDEYAIHKNEWYGIRTIYPQLDPNCSFEEFIELRKKVHSGELPFKINNDKPKQSIWEKLANDKPFWTKYIAWMKDIK